MVYLIKANGEKELFDKEKIKASCIRAGADQKLASEIAEKVEREVKEGMTTKKVLSLVLKFLKKHKPINQIYNLKRAIMSLGPEGYLFEEYFAQILNNYGYKTKTRCLMQGKAVEHEVDIIAEKESRFMIECKYHNQLGTHTNSKEAMYTYARYLDLSNNPANNIDKGWLATNTKCTPHALKYAKGVGLKITSWAHPDNESLQDLINQKKLYPITILTGVSRIIKQKFFEARIVMLNDLLTRDSEDLKRSTGIDNSKIQRLIDEAKKIIELKR